MPLGPSAMLHHEARFLPPIHHGGFWLGPNEWARARLSEPVEGF